jgi:glycosyltransferase involved in cell wall biosynthesis
VSDRSIKEPDVSLIVPTFNERPHILEQSLNSLRHQSHSNFECLLVDESTNDRSRDFAAAFCAKDRRFRHLVPTERLGLAASLNLGISLARAELIARFDADDICIANRLALQLNAMRANPDIGVFGGALELINDENQVLGYRSFPSDHESIMKKMMFVTAFSHPTTMMRASLVKAVGGYDDTFTHAEDLDLWLRLANHGTRFGNLSETLVRYRQNSVRRSALHWRFNYRARVKNFSSSYLVRRSLGLAAVGVWGSIPPFAQELIFRRLMLRSGQLS